MKDSYVNAHIFVTDKSNIDQITTYVKLKDLLVCGITNIEYIHLKRKKMPKNHAIYFLKPTQENVAFLLSDFADKDKHTYKRVHIVFTSKLKKEYLQ